MEEGNKSFFYFYLLSNPSIWLESFIGGGRHMAPPIKLSVSIIKFKDIRYLPLYEVELLVMHLGSESGIFWIFKVKDGLGMGY